MHRTTRLILLTVLWTLTQPAWSRAAETVLEQTFYYTGDMNGFPYLPATIDVDADGTVAVAINRTIGAGNQPEAAWLVLLYDAAGEPIGQIASPNSGMRAVTFGPDGRIYTAEHWFGAGAHVYDRAGCQPRDVPVRCLNADGAHPDHGLPMGVAVAPDYSVYTITRGQLHRISPDNKRLGSWPPPRAEKLLCAPDGTLYAGNQVWRADGTWAEFRYSVRDIRPDGGMLVTDAAGQWLIYHPKTDQVERPVILPPGNWSDHALGPDGNVYLTPAHDPSLAYVVADPTGKVLLRRGADFDRLVVRLTGTKLTSGGTLSFSAEAIRSRDLGYVATSAQLPHDNRPALQVRAAVAPLSNDPLETPRWQSLALTKSTHDRFVAHLPADLIGQFHLRIAATATDIPGLQPLAVQTNVTILPAGTRAWLIPATDRRRTGFVAGQPIRFHVTPTAADVDLTGATLVLTREGQTVCVAPMGEARVAVLPGELTARLRPGMYRARLDHLPVDVHSGATVIEIVSPVRTTLFETPLHPIGLSYRDALRDARLHAELGATHVVSPQVWDGTYLDLLTRFGLTFHYQPYDHYSPLNTLPQEQGALQPVIAAQAQRMKPFPAFRGFNYHDLQVQPWGGWSDTARNPYYEALWAEYARQAPVPDTVPADRRAAWATAWAVQSMLPRLYAVLGDTLRRVDPALDRTTMQWWHQPLFIADPDQVCRDQNLIATQHMEEQFYHSVSVANLVDLWRRPGLALWNYGNTTWQEDGTGASYYRDFMAALCRGAQGVGRNDLPRAGDLRSEIIVRTATPAFRLLHAYGGLAAACEPADQVAIWRSFYQEASEYGQPRHDFRQHLWHTTTAYLGCLYGHRTATLVTDDQVRAGALRRFQAVIVSFEHPLPPDLATPLRQFQEAGGLVLANQPRDGYWCPPGAVELGPLLNRNHCTHNRESLVHIGIEEDGVLVARELRKHMAGHVTPLIDCDDPTTWLSVLQHGAARYVFAVNLKRLPHDPMALHRFSGYENTGLPTKTELRLNTDAGAIYDVFAAQRVTPQAGRIIADMSIFPGAIFALLPTPIHSLQLQGGQSDDRTQLRLRVAVADASAKTIDAAVPLEVTIDDATGAVRYHLQRTARHGVWEETLPLAFNDPAGDWRITATELLSGLRAEAVLAVVPPPAVAVAPVPQVEWSQADRIQAALDQARRIALIGDCPAVVAERLTQRGKEIVRVTAADYLADRQALQWDKFRLGGLGTAEIQLRPRRYDLVIVCDTPGVPNAIVPLDLLPIAERPVPGHGWIQYAVQPVYDTEDAVVIAGGDADGLAAAAAALFAAPVRVTNPPPASVILPPVASSIPQSNRSTARGEAPRRGAGPSDRPALGLRRFIGLPVGGLAASADGQRIAVTMKGWGNNLFFLDDQGQVRGATMVGKFFPLFPQTAARGGFTVLEHETDQTTLYLREYNGRGQAVRRLAAFGRRIGGLRDWSPSQPEVIGSFLKQASFSLTPDGRYAAVGGSNGIAVWDLRRQTVLWRDPSVHYATPPPENVTAPTEFADSFPQAKISPDGRLLAVQHKGIVTVRDVQTGAARYQIQLPRGAAVGRVQLFDGHRLVVGDKEFFGFQGDRCLWRWKSPGLVSASAFAADGLEYVVGESDGTIRLMNGGGQIAGYMAPSGAVTSLAILPQPRRVAFATSSGWAGVLDVNGQLLWQARFSVHPVIAFLGTHGDTIVGDARGVVRRFDRTGRQLWETDLTPRVWRDDTPAQLTKRDDPADFPTMRVPAPERQAVALPAGRTNLALAAHVKYLSPRGWAREVVQPDRAVPLNDGKYDAPAGGWYNLINLEYVAFVPSPPVWELSWEQAVTVDTLVVHESAAHPEAVPQEIRVEAWVDGIWKPVVHEFWNAGTPHLHRFEPVTTTKLRYMPVGDLANNLYLAEIEVY